MHRRGRSVSSRFLVLYWLPQEEPAEPRIGFAVPRAAGGAVERNRIKRRLREVWNERLERVPAGHDYVLIVRPGLRRGGRDERLRLARRAGRRAARADRSARRMSAVLRAPGAARSRPRLALPADVRRALPDDLQVPPVLLGVRDAGACAGTGSCSGSAPRRLAPASLQPVEPRRLRPGPMMLFAIPIISQLEDRDASRPQLLPLEPRPAVGVVDRRDDGRRADDPRAADDPADPLDAEPAEATRRR